MYYLKKEKGEKMKKNLLYFMFVILLVIILIPSEETRVIEKKASNVTEKAQESHIVEVDQSSKVIKVINQPPIVEVGDEQNITFGDEVTLEAIAKDRDGNIVSYLWREGNKTLSEDERFDYKFDKGVHNLTVLVTDNNGAKAEDNVTVNVGIWVLLKVIVTDKFIAKCNKNGKFIKVSSFWHDGTVRFVDYYEYDEKGREISHAEDTYNDGNIDTNISKVFNEDGKIIEKINIHFGEMRVDDITKYTYNKNGDIEQKVQKLLYTRDEQKAFSSNRVDYKYNENNQLLEVLNGVDDGTRLWIIEKYSYKEGKLVLHESFEEGKKLLGREEYSYEDGSLKEIKKFYVFEDEKLKLLSKNYYNEKELLEKIIQDDDVIKQNYDDENRLILEERNSLEDEYSYREEYIYSDDGKLTSFIHYKKDENGEFEEAFKILHYDNGKIEKVFSHKNLILGSYKNICLSATRTSKEKREVYDEHKNLIEIWDDADDKLIEKRFYRFVYKSK